MSNLERKKIELELMKLEAARAELEYKVLEREEDIKRIHEHIAIQNEKIKETQAKLEDFLPGN